MTASVESAADASVLPQTAATTARIDSLHTANFPDLLRQLGGSLVVSTGDSGKLVILRPDQAVVGTHSIDLPRLGGVAADGQRIAVATSPRIIEFHNFPDVARHLHEPPRHDAVFLTRRGHVTGAVGISDMAWDGNGALWFASSLFSSLCTLDAQSAIVPRWRPRFVSRCAAQDCCHLNGLGLRDGKPRYVTALGETDTPQGWRANRRDSGILVDCQEDRIIARGLALPHSPRWHDNHLWLLESSRGALVTIDPQTGRKTDVARVPGFARGLAFLGRVAFIGLSQPREDDSTLDIVTTPSNAEHRSGIWAVHTDSGRTLALLTFSANVPDIVAVQALPGLLFPEIIRAGDLLSFSYALPPQALREVDPNLGQTLVPAAVSL